MLVSHSLFSPNSLFIPSHSQSSSHISHRPISVFSVNRSNLQTQRHQLLAQLSDLSEPSNGAVTAPQIGGDDGPIELPPSSSPVFASTDDPSPLQVATSVLLTGAISVFLFRSLRRRAKRAKEMRFRSTGANKNVKEEALDALNAMKLNSVEPGSPPSPGQALLGGLTAGVIAIILYKFTTTIEAALNRQTISDNFSVRQITITIRTIVNGLCYLATFVFGINSIGLILYSGQLVINSFMGESTDKETSNKDEGQPGTNSSSDNFSDKESSDSTRDNSNQTQ